MIKEYKVPYSKGSVPVVYGLQQWDAGQLLVVEDIDLGEEVKEIHFSLTNSSGTAKRVAAIYKSRKLTARIPNMVFEKEVSLSEKSYKAYAYIYLFDSTYKKTEYKICLEVDVRPMPEGYTSPEEIGTLEQIKVMLHNKLDKNGYTPNKFLGTDEQGNVVEKEQEKFTLETANETKLGGVKPLNKTDDMTLEVGVDKDGRLFAKGKDITVDSELSEESANPVQNAIVTKEVNALKKRNAELKETVEKLQIKTTTDKAPFHHITDSAKMKVVDFGMEGKIEQRTTSGKNKLNASNLVEKTMSGIKFTPVYTNGLLDYILVNGTATSTISYPIGSCDDVYLSVNKIIFTGCPSGGSTSTYMLVHISSGTADIGDGKEQVCSYLKDLNYAIRVMGGTTVSNLKFYPMVRLATETDATYEPYSDMPAPNPDCQQEVKLAGVYNEETGRYEHKCCVGNKNFATELIRGLLVDESGTISTVSTYYTNNFMNVKRFLPKGTYTIHIHGIKICIARYILNGKYVNLSSAGMDKFSFTVSDMSETIICFSKGDGNVFDGSELVQLEYEGSVTDYIEGKNQPFTLTSDRPLTKWDNLVKVDGKWYWDYKQLKLVVDGNKNWYVYTYTSNNYCGFRCEGLDFNGSRKSGYCNQLIVETSVSKNSNRLWLGVSNNNNIYAVNSSYFDDTLEDKGLANWKAHLNEYPLEIYTYKDESELVPLLDEEQELLRNLETYYGVTNVYNEQGCPISLTYVADQELHWNQKLLQIQQAII